MFAHTFARRLFSLPYRLLFHLARALVLPAPRRPRPSRPQPLGRPVHPLMRAPVSYAETVLIETRRRFWWLS